MSAIKSSPVFLCLVRAAAVHVSADAAIVVTDFANITLANTDLGGEVVDITGGATGPLISYTASGTFVSSPFDATSLNHGDVRIGYGSTGQFAILQDCVEVQGEASCFGLI